MLYVKGIWERGTFTVPDGIPEVRVNEKIAMYKRQFGELLERQGFTVLGMTSPTLSIRRLITEPGRKRYDLFARVIRKPQTVRLHIPDKAVPALMAKGMRLLD